MPWHHLCNWCQYWRQSPPMVPMKWRQWRHGTPTPIIPPPVCANWRQSPPICANIGLKIGANWRFQQWHQYNGAKIYAKFGYRQWRQPSFPLQHDIGYQVDELHLGYKYGRFDYKQSCTYRQTYIQTSSIQFFLHFSVICREHVKLKNLAGSGAGLEPHDLPINAWPLYQLSYPGPAWVNNITYYIYISFAVQPTRLIYISILLFLV